MAENENQTLNQESATSSEADKIISEMEKTQAGEQSASTTEVKPEMKETPFHEHPRFKELIEEKNALKRKLDEMQSQIASTLNKQNQIDPVGEAASAYAKLGLKEDQAQAIAKVQADLATKITNQRIGPVEEASLRAITDTWVANFAKDHADFDDLQPLMFETFSKLPERVRDSLSSSPEVMELLYAKAKQAKGEELIQAAFKKGVQEGYAKKQEKVAGASTAGTSSVKPSDFSEESILAHDVKWYKDNLPAILASRAMKR